MSRSSQENREQSHDLKAKAKCRMVGEEILSLFDASALGDEAAIYTASSMLDRFLHDSDFAVDEILAVLDSTPYLIEFVLCVASDHAFKIISREVLRPPCSAPGGLRHWMAFKLITSFSDRLPPGLPPTLVVERDVVESTSSLLAVLAALLESGELADDSAEMPLGHRTTKARREKHHGAGRTLHTGRLRGDISDYGMDLPTTKSEAESLAKRVVHEQTVILQEYLNAFRTSEVAAVYKRVYLPHLSSVIDEVPTHQHELQPAGGTLGPWRILMSPRAERDLRKVRGEDKKRLKIILRKMKDLSMGYFTPDNYKPLAGGDSDIPIYEAKMTRDSRLIYYIDCLSDFDTKRHEQVIKICGIYTHAQIDQRFWNSVSRNLQIKSLDTEYRKRCVFRKTDPKGECVYLPETFIPTSEVSEQNDEVVPPSPVVEITPEHQDQLQELLMMDQFMTFSREYLTCIIEDQDIASVFDTSWLSDREMEIMYHPYSCFVLGRGGTGKTTTMVYKILAQERSWADRFKTTMRKPRQLFVTQSQVLVQKVEEYYARRSQSFAVGHSRKDFAAMSTAYGSVERMVDADEEVYWNSALPKRYGALRDEDFPMFLTFDHLCRLLEGEFQHMVEQEKTGRTQTASLRDILRMRPTSSTTRKDFVELHPRAAFVDYDTFLEKYWAHLPDASRDPRLSPELVFGEIMGVIKGSERALASEQGYLDQETYCNIRRRSHATSDRQRELIYGIFEAYTKRKKQYGQYDAADRTRMLLKCLDAARFPRDMLPKFIYVDEAQDNLLIDALVLRKLCSNPHGMFWAGDTAQTISAGSAFRFDELKAFMYRVGQDQEGGVLGTQTQAQSETFHLTANFRSHAGIVNCAHSVVQLLMKHWPDSVDRLPQERGQIAGRKPLFFSDRDGAELQHALFRDTKDGGRVEFGTEQCILVRNDAARKRLRREMGDVGQILTVYESKGLEFNDVLLYYPFGDSTVDGADWDVLLNEIPGRTGPEFNVARHAGVCRELKHLYVAITRARTNLWILDCSRAAAPLQLLWAELDLIDIHPPGAPVPRLAVSSGKEEWVTAARNLFRKRQYSEAMHGFERAGLQHEHQVSLAYLLRDQARSTPANPRVGITQTTAFAKAADAFQEAAAGAEDDSDQKTYFRIAAECYARAGDDRKAGSSYRSAEKYALAAQHFRKAGSFDDAVKTVKEHHDEIPPELSQRIIDISKLQYIRENRVEKAKALRLFEDDAEALEYMNDFGLDLSRASYLEKLGKFAEAADCHLSEGSRLEALRLLSRDRHSEQSTVKAVRCILDGLWEHLSLGTPEENWRDPMIEDLLGHAEILNTRWVSSASRNELLMFQAVFKDDIATLSSLGGSYIEQDRLAAAVLCLDQVFSHSLALEAADLDEITTCFRSFLGLARALQRLTCIPDPCNSQEIQKLLAVKASSEEMFYVSRLGYLFTLCNSMNTSSMQPTRGGLLIPRWELEPLIRKTLQDRLKGHVQYQNEMAHQLGPRVQPCILFALHRYCPKYDCKQLHIAEVDAVTTYNALVRIRLIQVMIFHTLYASDVEFAELHHQQRVLLRRLYEALYPPHVNLGSLHTISFDLVPELRQARPILRVWVRDFLNRINPREDPPKAFLVNLMRATRLAMQFDQRATTENLPRIPCAVRHDRPPQLLRSTPHGEQYVVHDLIGMLRCEDHNALDRGIRFVSYVMQRRVYVDIGVLCDFMDHLCSAMLVAVRSDRLQKSSAECLHGLVLPTTWWIRIISGTDRLALMSTRELRKYISIAGRLLQAIYTGSNAGHLLFENRDMSCPGLNQTRMVYIERVCKNLYFWGHNLGSVQAKQGIVNAIAALRGLRTNGALQKDASRYTDVKDWSTFSRLMLPSLQKSRLDQLVQLQHRSLPLPRTAMSDAKRVVFSRVSDILGQLNAEHIPRLSSDAGLDMLESRSNGSGRVPDRKRSEASRDLEDDDDTDTPQVEFTPEEEAAAVKIAAVYRRHMGRKAAGKDALTEMRRRVLAEFQAKAEAVSWRNSSYGVLFRRAVPRLVLVLECLKDYFHTAKGIAKARVQGVPHHELEDVQAALDEVSKRFKEVCALHKALLPVTASVHKTCDLVRLTEHSRSVLGLHSYVENQGDGHDWQVDLQLAIALIARFGCQPGSSSSYE